MIAGTLLLLVASTDPVAACEAAVRSAPETAVAACTLPKDSIDVLNPASLSGTCQDALKAGQQVGQVPPAFRKGLITQFEQKLEACRAPSEPEKILPRKTVRLWD